MLVEVRSDLPTRRAARHRVLVSAVSSAISGSPSSFRRWFTASSRSSERIVAIWRWSSSGAAARLYVGHRRGPLMILESVLGGVERRPRLPDFIELEDGLDLFGALGRLDEDEAQDLAAWRA